MKLRIFSLFVLFCLISILSSPVFADPPKMGTVEDVTAFSHIRARGPMVVEVTVGEAPSVQVELSKKGHRLVHVKIKDDTLILRPEVFNPPINLVGLKARVIVTTTKVDSVRSQASADIVLTGKDGGPLDVKSIGSGQVTLVGRADSLDANIHGSGDLRADRFTAGVVKIKNSGQASIRLGGATTSLELDSMGQGDFHIRKIDVHKLVANILGGADLNLSGKAKKAVFDVNGSGDIDARKLAVDEFEATMGGSGDITVTVNQSIKVNGYGSGNLYYYGDAPETSIKVHGSTTVEHKK